MSRALITSDPAVMMGKPVVAGTRLTVELLLEKAGMISLADESAAATILDRKDSLLEAAREKRLF